MELPPNGGGSTKKTTWFSFMHMVVLTNQINGSEREYYSITYIVSTLFFIYSIFLAIACV